MRGEGARNVSEKDDECHAKLAYLGKPDTQLSPLKDDDDPNRYRRERPSELNKDDEHQIADTRNEWPILNKRNLAHFNSSAARFADEQRFEQRSRIKTRISDK